MEVAGGMFRLNPSDLRRQLKRLGLKNVDIETPEASEVVIRLADGREIVAEAPEVMIVKLPQGAAMIQVVAQNLEERNVESAQALTVSEEDVRLVAEQAGVSLEEARNALIEAGGDIAAAIILLEERKKAS